VPAREAEPLPTYAYRCDKCEDDFDRILPMSRYDEPQMCETCGETARKLVVPVSFNLSGDDWPSKNGRVSKQMRDKNTRLGAKQDARKKDGSGISLVPNVGGERVESWGEAQKLAGSKGKDTTSYDSKVRQEQATKK
jgi:putative FmdB family regulatory protein